MWRGTLRKNFIHVQLILFHWARLMSPSTHYRVIIFLRVTKDLKHCRLFHNAIADVPDGVATDVSIRPEKQSSSDQRGTAVINWNHPICQNSKILGWQILIRRVRSNTEFVRNISNLASRFEFDVKPCEIYHFIIRTQYEDGGDRYTTRERSFEANCPEKFLVPIIAIVILLLVAFIIAFVFLRMQRRSVPVNFYDTYSL